MKMPLEEGDEVVAVTGNAYDFNVITKKGYIYRLKWMSHPDMPDEIDCLAVSKVAIKDVG